MQYILANVIPPEIIQSHIWNELIKLNLHTSAFNEPHSLSGKRLTGRYVEKCWAGYTSGNTVWAWYHFGSFHFIPTENELVIAKA